MTDILADEIIDDLQLDGLKIIQKANGFKFGSDAVLISDFAKDNKSNKTLDLCTGTGIIPLLLSKKTSTKKICGIEIQHDICDMAKRSVLLNNLTEQISITEGNLLDAVSIYGKCSFDTITCNPPYMEQGSGLINKADTKLISRHEIYCTLDDVIRVSQQLLIPMGRFIMVHRPSRLADIITIMRKYKLEPKRIRFVQPSVNKAPNLLLIEGIKGAGKELLFMPNLIMYNDDLTPTDEINKIYNRS